MRTMENKRKVPGAVWLWLLMGTATLFTVVALAIGLKAGAQVTSGKNDRVEEACVLEQTIHYDRCGHAVTRRMEADKEYRGATLAQMQQAYADWSITSFAPAEIIMSCHMPIFCPDHLVVMPDGAGVLGVYLNEYGEGYTLQKQLEVPLTDLTEDVLQTVHLGLGFANMNDIESWLETLES